MILGRLNPEKILHANLTDLSTSPTRRQKIKWWRFAGQCTYVYSLTMVDAQCDMLAAVVGQLGGQYMRRSTARLPQWASTSVYSTMRAWPNSTALICCGFACVLCRFVVQSTTNRVWAYGRGSSATTSADTCTVMLRLSSQHTSRQLQFGYNECTRFTSDCRHAMIISGADNCIYQKNLLNCHTSTKIGRHMHYSLLFHNRTLATRIFKMAVIFQDGHHFRYAIPYNFDTV